MLGDSKLSVTDASGRLVSILNGDMRRSPEDNEVPQESSSKRKYHCSEPSCNKSFTTSGHLARHNRIHTGEKNFHCLFPGCQSRFSRQDNMMQHYRTHMSPKSRRSQKRGLEEARPRPRLHAHQRIKSDPENERKPMTIEQHLDYHHSLMSHSPSVSSPLMSALRNNSISSSSLPPIAMQPSSSTSSHYEGSQPISNRTSRSNSSCGHSGSMPASPTSSSAASPTSSATIPHLFYQHRPLVYPAKASPTAGRSAFLSTLLHPEIPSSLQKGQKNDEDAADGDASSGGLLQLAHIVSTFG